MRLTEDLKNKIKVAMVTDDPQLKWEFQNFGILDMVVNDRVTIATIRVQTRVADIYAPEWSENRVLLIKSQSKYYIKEYNPKHGDMLADVLQEIIERSEY